MYIYSWGGGRSEETYYAYKEEGGEAKSSMLLFGTGLTNRGSGKYPGESGTGRSSGTIGSDEDTGKNCSGKDPGNNPGKGDDLRAWVVLLFGVFGSIAARILSTFADNSR